MPGPLASPLVDAHTVLVMADIRSWEDLERVLAGGIPEGPTLEYKRELNLDSKSDRLEALKDVSGMGNGGGGTLVYGVEESANGVPSSLHLLSERGLTGRLEDIIRTGIRPLLLMSHQILERDNGYILALAVQRSPLGPYMVEAYDERRYYIRMGTRTVPMGEAQIRDAYALALRAREGRPAVWQQHFLPLRAETASPWLTVSALPEEPLIDLFDPGVFSLDELQLPDEFRLQRDRAGLDSLLAQRRIWAEGIFGEDRYPDRNPTAVFRLHRDGAIGIGAALPERLPMYTTMRKVNAFLFYLAWLWRRIGLRTPLELDIALLNLDRATFVTPLLFPDEERSVRQPAGVPVNQVMLRRYALLPQLCRAAFRHGLVREFGDRLYQAFGLHRAEIMFRGGWLFGSHGGPIGLSLWGAGIWDTESAQKGLVYQGGPVTSPQSPESIAGFLVDGAILDAQGRTLAVVELGSGPGVPDDFVHVGEYDDPRPRAPQGGGEQPRMDRPFSLPKPTGRWSASSLIEALSPPDARR
jgi:hypothetical protein